MEQNEKQKVVTLALPDKIKDILIDRAKTKQKAVQEYLQICFNVDKGIIRKQEIVKELQNLDISINDRITEGARKLRLEKQTDRTWQFNGKDGFIGTLKESKETPQSPK